VHWQAEEVGTPHQPYRLFVRQVSEHAYGRRAVGNQAVGGCENAREIDLNPRAELGFLLA
jgi:hypothetical protein